MPTTLHNLELDVDSFGRAYGPAGLDDLLQDIHRGWHARAVLAPLNQQRAGALARQCERKPGSRFCVEEVYDAADFHAWLQWEGIEAWLDDTFIKEHRRDVPDCVVSTGKAPSNSIIVPATRWTAARAEQGAQRTAQRAQSAAA